MVENRVSNNSFSQVELDIIRNFEIKENLPLRSRVFGLAYVFPEMCEPINFYLMGSLAVLNSAKFFSSSIATRSLIEHAFFGVESDLSEVFLNQSFANNIVDAHDPIFNYNKGLAVNLNEWGYIKDESPLVLLDDSNFLKKIHGRIISSENLNDMFDKFWNVYESCVKKIPQGELLDDYVSYFLKLSDASNRLNSGKMASVDLPRKLNFADNINLDEGLSIFKEQYHDVLLERKLNKYF